MKKKGQGLSLNVIIIAAIGLIVLVLLIAIFTGRIGTFRKSVAREEAGLTCPDLGGSWSTNPCGEGETELFGVTQADDLRAHAGQNCCKLA